MTNINWTNSEAICCVLANERSRETLEKVFQSFLEEREILDSNYCMIPGNPSGCFAGEKEMIEFFIQHPNTDQAFFWRDIKKKENTVGACFNSDGSLVITVTTYANGIREFENFEKLKSVLNTDIGFISYNLFPCFDGAADFRKLAAQSKQKD